MTCDYHADKAFGDLGFIVRVTSTMEALGDQPWHVLIIPGDIALPTKSYTVESESGFGAASDALGMYKEEQGLNPSTVWSL